ncbi:MAG: phosphoribosyl-AMP cyclohydrolase [Deltaproteobacteria bacterium]|nr:phosphoribosyl-AMP cyclohydrolase [Deltaproteobacteria bacterium]
MRADAQGLVPCVVQDVKSRRVLMVAWVNKAALAQTLDTGWATFWSRSRAAIWQKGSTSGHRQRLLHVRLDCDGDTLVYTVEPLGPACHEGYDTCFTWRRVGNGWKRDPEPVAYPEPRAPALMSDLIELLEVGTPSEEPPPQGSRPSVKDIRVGAPIESRARALANALQLKQKERAPTAAAELLAEVLRGLRSHGLGVKEIRAVLENLPTAPATPAEGGVAGPAGVPAAAPVSASAAASAASEGAAASQGDAEVDSGAGER